MKYFKSFYYLLAILVIGVTVVPTTVSAQSDGNDAVFQAIRSSNVKMLNKLVINGADINGAKSHGYTPLMEAAKLGDKDVVAFLLDNQANVNAQNNAGGTALILAAKYGHPLLTNNFGNKPLDFAVAFDKDEAADILRQAERRLGSS